MLQLFDDTVGTNHTQVGSAPGVGCVLSIPASPMSLLQRGGSGSGRSDITPKPHKLLTRLLTWKPDQLNLTPVSFQV